MFRFGHWEPLQAYFCGVFFFVCVWVYVLCVFLMGLYSSLNSFCQAYNDVPGSLYIFPASDMRIRFRYYYLGSKFISQGHHLF